MTGRSLTSERVGEPIEELSIVALKRAVVMTEEDRTLPMGASGTVVATATDCAAYIVEFTEPFAALVDLVDADFSVVSGGRRADLKTRRLAHRAP